MYPYVRDTKVLDITHFWTDNDLESVFSDESKGAVSCEGKRYAIAIPYYY